MIDLRLGRWEEALSDVDRVDCIITDPPYSERTHINQGLGASYCREDAISGSGNLSQRRPIGYRHMLDGAIEEVVESLSGLCSGWFCVFSDHASVAHWSSALESSGRYVFHPVPCVMRGMTCRLAGDGPSSWAVYLVVARPRSRSFMRWGSLPGAYSCAPERDRIVVGGKPLDLMRAIVRDYSRPGDLILDPFAGGGTTLLAGAIEGRRSIGAEVDPDTYAKAKARIDRGYTPALRFDEPKVKQGDMF